MSYEGREDCQFSDRGLESVGRIGITGMRYFGYRETSITKYIRSVTWEVVSCVHSSFRSSQVIRETVDEFGRVKARVRGSYTLLKAVEITLT